MSSQYCSSFSLATLEQYFDGAEVKLALYGPGAPAFDSDTTVYTSEGEITPTGYIPGGKMLTMLAGYPKLEDGWGSVRFDTVQWTFTSRATIRRGLIYNSSDNNAAILSIVFPLTSTQAGNFTVRFPLSLPPQVQHRFSLG